MDTFARLYGVSSAAPGKRSPHLHLAVTESHLNWNGDAHGGCSILLSTLAAQRAAHHATYGGSFTYHFLRRVPFGAELETRSHVLKAGRLLTCSRADIMSEGRLVGYMTADSMLRSARVEEVLDRKSRHQPPRVDYYMNPVGVPGIDLRPDGIPPYQLFECIDSQEQFFAQEHNEPLCVGLQTNESYADSTSFINEAIFGCVADNALGLACCALGKSSVTVNLNIMLLRKAEPGALIACQATTALNGGSFYTAHGVIWADNKPVGLAEGLFYEYSEHAECTESA